MSQRSLLFDLIHGHVYRITNCGVYVDYEGFFLATQEHCATIGCGHYALYIDFR